MLGDQAAYSAERRFPSFGSCWRNLPTAIAGRQNEGGAPRRPECEFLTKKICSGRIEENRGDIMKWLWAALGTSCCIVSAQAFTCADVRTLSLEPHAYY